jgi:hypothetical protein
LFVAAHGCNHRGVHKTERGTQFQVERNEHQSLYKAVLVVFNDIFTYLNAELKHKQLTQAENKFTERQTNYISYEMKY